MKDCKCCDNDTKKQTDYLGKYVCYCNKVTEEDIIKAIKNQGASTIDEVIKQTGAMKNSNCIVNNPKGICCYNDIAEVFSRNT